MHLRSRQRASKTSKAEPAIYRVNLECGYDQLIIDDPDWCEAIAAEAQQPPPEREYAAEARFSRHDDEFDAQMAAAGLSSRADHSGLPRGFARLPQRPVAEKCLRELLQVDLPAALLIRYGWTQPSRLVALRTYLEGRCSFLQNTLDVSFVFDGLQLYSTGQVGRPVHMMRLSDKAQLQRRTLDNVWRNSSFDGLTLPDEKADRWSTPPRRTFFLLEGHIVDHTGASLRKLNA